jgi:hypothetical protein
MARPFKVKPFTNIDKRVEITGPDYLQLFVDFDDVNHAEVRKQIKKMVALLNKHWDDAKKQAAEDKINREYRLLPDMK